MTPPLPFDLDQTPNLDREVAALLREVARAEVMPRFRTLRADQIREKAPGDYVTEADTACEAVLTARLTELLPGSLVVGEEAVAADPAVLNRFNEDRPVWIIDPVDGTRNFAEGRTKFAVIVALVWHGETLAGWIHDPVADQTVQARKGAGAWLGEQHLSLSSQCRPLDHMTGSPGALGNKALSKALDKVIHNASAGHDYLALARGEIDFAAFRGMRPWDHAAGILILEEAGGHTAFLDGSPYRLSPPDVGGILATCGRQTWERVRELIRSP